MSGKISIPDDVPVLTANVVPFLISHNDSANTHTYFTVSKIKLESTGEYEAQFRGLRLIGTQCDLGDKVGYVCDVSEYLKPDPVEAGATMTCKQFVATNRIEELLVYGHEAPPPSNSKYRLLQELDMVSQAVHG